MPPSHLTRNEFLYTGRRLDPKTGLYQYRYRYYHAQLGRFLTRDPNGQIVLASKCSELPCERDTVPFTLRDNSEEISDFDPLKQYDDGMNLYLYVDGRPTYYTDPYGLFTWPWDVVDEAQDRRDTGWFGGGHHCFANCIASYGGPVSILSNLAEIPDVFVDPADTARDVCENTVGNAVGAALNPIAFLDPFHSIEDYCDLVCGTKKGK